ncbi:MAG: DUF6508 domain-containing protein [Dehalococcoidia bacterium]
MNEPVPLSPDVRRQIEALLPFLPMLESRHAGEWRGGERQPDGSITMPYFEYGDGMLAFIRACGENGWIEVFEWPAWAEEARRLHDDPATLNSADVPTIRKLLTLHIRNDRFNEGHLAAMVEDGHLAAVVRRLEQLRAASQ